MFSVRRKLMLATLGTLRVKLTLAWYKKNSRYSIGDQHRRQRNVPCISLVCQYVFPRLSGWIPLGWSKSSILFQRLRNSSVTMCYDPSDLRSLTLIRIITKERMLCLFSSWLALMFSSKVVETPAQTFFSVKIMIPGGYRIMIVTTRGSESPSAQQWPTLSSKH